MSQVETVRIKAETSEDNPLGFIIINKSDFKDGEHELFVEDPTGVTLKPNTVEQIKAALAEKNIEIPAGVTLKADLQALLDAAPAA
ncbi:hypothetical protein Herbaro_09390 [Herbaspirillum sp. WKF16]|uniref:hypothetical protein n=1 Tax=Herbaspirillum sp. WKF16 TaxID=3028312 RepID=UPI0023A931B1|nr:hypothetical protein [Herbaspirillum sp. WKF16]WDZ97973.1 hypothetical protein Herbaro_09390 [Herbaspirillum sp. WKF16]